MKEVTAYVHRDRVASVVAALKASPAWGDAVMGREHNLAVYLVKGSMLPFDARERHYSMELGDEVVNEFKLELLCKEENVDELVAVIRKAARTGQANAGWITVTNVEQALPIL